MRSLCRQCFLPSLLLYLGACATSQKQSDYRAVLSSQSFEEVFTEGVASRSDAKTKNSKRRNFEDVAFNKGRAPQGVRVDPESSSKKGQILKLTKACVVHAKPNNKSSVLAKLKSGKSLWIQPSEFREWYQVQRKAGVAFVRTKCF